MRSAWLVLASILVLCGPAQAQRLHAVTHTLPHGSQHHVAASVLSPIVCMPTSGDDVNAQYINKFGHLMLDIKVTPGTNGDYAGGELDGVDGIPFQSLEFDFNGTCTGFFFVVLFTSEFPEGVVAPCVAATITPGRNGFQHMKFDPTSFNIPPGEVMNGASIVLSNEIPAEMIISNPKLNSRSLNPNAVTTGCQFTL